MGLAVGVGVLASLLENDQEGADWLEEGFASANLLLEEEGLPKHAEPRTFKTPALRASIRSFPYSFIHYVRRAYAHRSANPAWMACPLDHDVDPSADPLVEDELDMMCSHLICHSDAEGFYLPIDFSDVLFAGPEDSSLPGGMVGSSYRLLEELKVVAPALGIRLNDGRLPDNEAARINELVCSGEGIYRELCSWLALYEAACLSIELKTAIVFS